MFTEHRLQISRGADAEKKFAVLLFNGAKKSFNQQVKVFPSEISKA